MLGCGAEDELAGGIRQPVVSGADDRVEYFEVTSPELRARVSQSMVALVPSATIGQPGAGYPVDAPRLGAVENLCPDERFIDQPSAAFCSGVLVDWDLVLTAGHCLLPFSLADFSVVLGYYYGAPSVLAIDEVRRPVDIVSVRLDRADADPRLDYAWVRLDARVGPGHRPLPIRTQASAPQVGAPVVSIGAVSGTPLKIDQGGVVQDARIGTADYFVASTDTSHGSSGGAALDPVGLALLGVFARGAPDFEATADGCNVTARQANPALAAEQFTYASAALAGLCSDAPGASSLCRSDCGDPCVAAAAQPTSSGGCAVGGAGRPDLRGPLLAAILVLAIRRRARGTRRG